MIITTNIKKCQIFTPFSTVEYMLDKVGYVENIFGKKIVDLSCGDGRFLVAIVKRFISDGLANGATSDDVKNAIERCIYGYEIDAEVYFKCIENLNSTTAEMSITNIKWNVHCADGLKTNEYNEFDYVVGNPPYIAYKDLSIETRKFVKKNFLACCKGKFDYSYAFIEAGLRLLNKTGRMILISPSNMFKALFGEVLRELIKPYIIGIINCEKEKIFQHVLISPSITVYSKCANTDIINYQFGLEGEISFIKKNELDGKWVFASRPKGNSRFGDYFKVSNSIATLANKVFVHNVDQNNNVVINGICLENNLLRVAKSPRYEQYGIKQKIIFPYSYVDGKLKKIDLAVIEQKYPNVYRYLLIEKTNLEKRDTDKSAKWFEFGRSQALSHLNQEKLMLSSIITNQVTVYQLSKEEIPYSGFYVVPIGERSLEYAIDILKSQDFYHYIIKIGVPISGDSVRISSKDIENYKFEE